MWLVWLGENGFVRILRIGILLYNPARNRCRLRYAGRGLFSLRGHEAGRSRVLQRRREETDGSVAGDVPFPLRSRCRARGRYRLFRCGFHPAFPDRAAS